MRIVPDVGGAMARAIVLLGWIVAPGCSPGESPPTAPNEPEPPAALDVKVEVVGSLPDPDGYAVILAVEGEGDRPAEQAAPTGGTIRFPDLPPGTHAVRLESLAENCRVANGSNPRPVTVEAGRTRTLAITVYCRGPGTLVVHTVTRGQEADPDGYAIAFEADSTREERMEPNDTFQIGEHDLPPGGRWTVRLTGVAGNCLVVSANPALVTPFTRDSPSHLTFSVLCLPSASRIAFTSSDGDIFLAPVGGASVNLTNHPAWDGEPSLSPDRRSLVFTSTRDREEMDLYLLDVDLRTVSRLTSGPGFHRVGRQAWSPDGTRIVFSATRGDSTFHVYVLSLATGDLLELTDDPRASDFDAAWSPDGSSIAFCRIRETDDGVFAVTVERMSAADGSGIVRVAVDACGPVWSPDGSRIAFTVGLEDEFAQNRVAVIDAAGQGPVAFLASGFSPTWAPDGGSIVYSAIGGSLVIAEFSGQVLVNSFPLFQGFSPSWR